MEDILKREAYHKAKALLLDGDDDYKVTKVAELLEQLKQLKEENAALTKENKELKQYTEVSTDKIDELVGIIDTNKNERYQVLKTEIRVKNKLLSESVAELSRLREREKELEQERLSVVVAFGALVQMKEISNLTEAAKNFLWDHDNIKKSLLSKVKQ